MYKLVWLLFCGLDAVGFGVKLPKLDLFHELFEKLRIEKGQGYELWSKRAPF